MKAVRGTSMQLPGGEGRAYVSVSGAGAAELPLVAQTYFCDSRYPLGSPLRDLPLLHRSRSGRSSHFPPHPLTAPLPLTRFLIRSAPVYPHFRSNVSSSKLKKWTDFWATVCITVRPILSDRCLSCQTVLSVLSSCL